MEIYEALILGIIQGVTEWLPLSSSGHLVMAEYLLGVHQPLVFDVIIQLGSVVVVIAVFYKELFELIKGIFNFEKESVKFASLIILATIPAVVFGLLFRDFISQTYKSLFFNGICFLITAVLLFLSKYPVLKEKDVNYSSALIMGFAQALSILPAVSRSGATISAGMMSGCKRELVAKFSFIMLIPVMIGAAVLEIYHGGLANIQEPGMVAFATIVAMISGFFSLKLLMKMIKKNYFSHFGVYCTIIGIILIVFSIR